MASYSGYMENDDPSYQQVRRTAWEGFKEVADIGLIGAYIGGEFLHSKLTQDKFYSSNSKLVNSAMKAAKRPGYNHPAYASSQYKAYSERVLKNNLGIAKAAEKEVQLTEAGFSSALKKSMWRKGGAKVLGGALNTINFIWMAPMLYGATYHGFRGIQRLGYQLQRPDFGAHMTLPTAAFTDRQRGMQAMMNSELNARSAMGREAFIYHR